jgi:cytochrome c oxidase cbb3-type subunit 1
MKQDTAAKTMIISATLFFGFALTMGLLTALKFIVPTVGEIEYLSMPRVRMVHTNINLYGWLLQANMGILFWILPRILHTKLFSEKLGVAMGILYNLTLLGGFTCIFLGKIQNVEYGEMPLVIDVLITICWVMFAINVFGTIATRKVKYLYVSVWYTLGAVIWTTFVWITGNLITAMPMVTGINQANLSWFFVHNAVGLIFTPMGVAIAYYLIPKQLNTPIYSHKLSMIGFWVISFVYVWTGAHHMIHGPISHWLQTVSIIFSFSLIIPVMAVITNFFGTFATAPRETRMDGPIPKLLMMGTVYYIFTCLQGPFQAIRAVNEITSKTDWVVGHAHMALFGAFSYFAMAGIYYIAPKLAGRELFSKKLGDLHFWIMTLASIPFFAVLWISGVIQGFAWLNPENTFVQTLAALKHAHVMRFATGGFIFISYFLFLYNVMQTFFGKYGPDTDVEPAAEQEGI